MECGVWGVGADHSAAVGNQCLYLSLAAAVLPPGTSHAITAASFRRRIEATVLAANPQWVDPAGPNAGAFADFPHQGLPAVDALRRHPVAIYNSIEGTCEVFRSPSWHDQAAPVIAR